MDIDVFRQIDEFLAAAIDGPETGLVVTDALNLVRELRAPRENWKRTRAALLPTIAA